jgi:8-oxo-dGTP pyrophosphatase MutT (NUDIX family)
MRNGMDDMVSGRSGGGEAALKPAWREHIRARLSREPSDAGLREAARPAAVLVPFVAREEPFILLTKRTDDMPTHAGQVCFPGGRFHQSDATFTATALREFEEETGIARSCVEVAGYLDPFETAVSGFLILPVVGFLPPDYKLSFNAREVADVFEVPLSHLMDANNRGRMVLERAGSRREFVTIEYRGHTIWGATASMLFNLEQRLRAP